MIYFKSRLVQEVQSLRIWKEEINLEGKWTMQNSFEVVKGLLLQEAREGVPMCSGPVIGQGSSQKSIFFWKVAQMLYVFQSLNSCSLTSANIISTSIGMSISSSVRRQAGWGKRWTSFGRKLGHASWTPGHTAQKSLQQSAWEEANL